MVPSILSFLIAVSHIANALIIHEHNQDSTQRRYVKSWSHSSDHSSNKLFKRAPSGSDGKSYPEVGSDDWSRQYPTGGVTPGVDHTPSEWLQQLKFAQDAGKIPNIPPSTLNNGNPTYPNMDAGGPQICSSTYQCRGPDDIYDTPEGVFGVSFDDGPLGPTTTLVDFLQKNNEVGTHFMIGSNILANPTQFKAVYDYGGDCAVHTWTHPYMTTLTNEQVVAELGWTMQIIHDSTGGRVPKLWRPPYGDSDVRVRAIAREVFGLTTVIWNQDSNDWSIGSGGQSLDGISKLYDGWVSGSKNPGLMILEHELSDQTVQAFVNNYPKIKSNGWQTQSVARIFDGSEPYQNTEGDKVAVASVYLNNGTTSQVSSSSTSATSTSTSSSASPSTSDNAESSKSSTRNAASHSANALFAFPTTLLSTAVTFILCILS